MLKGNQQKTKIYSLAPWTLKQNIGLTWIIYWLQWSCNTHVRTPCTSCGFFYTYIYILHIFQLHFTLNRQTAGPVWFHASPDVKRSRNSAQAAFIMKTRVKRKGHSKISLVHRYPPSWGSEANFYADIFSSSTRKLDGRILRSESLAASKGRYKSSNSSVNT